MSETLEQIANELKSKNKKVQLIYAFNGTGKTRLSKEFQKLICKKKTTKKIDEEQKRKFLYYSAYTEDLFYWDNDIENNEEPKLKIQGNDFTNWILKVQGKEGAIVKNFQYYINNDKLVPKFNEEYKIKNQENKDIVIPAYSEVTFSLQKGDDTNSGNIKISKGEESLFIWCVFYSIFEQVIEELNEKDRQVQHLLRVCKILEIALNNALGLDYLYTDAYSEAEKQYEAEEAKQKNENQ